MIVIVTSKCDSARFVKVEGSSLIVSDDFSSCTKFEESCDELHKILKRVRCAFPDMGFVAVTVPYHLLGTRPRGVFKHEYREA